MPPSLQHTNDYANEVTPSGFNNSEASRNESSSSRTQSTRGYDGSDTQYQYQQQQPLFQDHATSYASRDHDSARPANARRPSGIALPTYQALTHDPVYMAARTSPIGPPPRAALPALPPILSPTSSSGSRGPPPRGGLPAIPNNPSGMMAMASESRPVTAVFNGDWAYPSPTNDPHHAPYNNGYSDPISAGSQYKARHSSQERARHTSTSAPRQQRQDHNEDHHPYSHSQSYSRPSPSTSRHARHGTEASSTSSPSAAEAGPSSSQPPQGEGATGQMASKTVLTIALMEAQNAVKLDESEQAEAALASYTKSVGLLQEVMRRVTENAGTYRQKEMDRLAQMKQDRLTRWRQWRIEQYRRAGVEVTADEIDINDEEIETREERKDREKREARIARRDRMRVEECAKLRVIHDTYAERIQALREELVEHGSEPSTPAGGFDTRSQPSNPEVEARRQFAGLAIGEASSTSQVSPSYSTSTTTYSPHSNMRSIDKPVDATARADIGSAMLANSPLSPTFSQTLSSASSSNPRASQLKSSAVPFPSSPPSSQNEARRSYTSATSASPPSLALPEIHPFSFSPANPTNGTRPSSRTQPRQSSPPAQNSVLSFSPDSEKADSAHFSDQQQSPKSGSLRTHRKNASSSASFNKTLPTPDGYANFGDLASQTVKRQPSPIPPAMPLHAEQEETDAPEGLATPTPDTANSKAFASPPTSNDERRSQASPATRSRASSRASNALRHMTSSESLASNTTSSSAGGHWSNAAQSLPLPPVPAVPKGASVSPPLAPSSAGSRASIVGASRPLRSASLVAGQATSDRSGQASSQASLSSSTNSEKQRANALLINPSTLHGTISQRRKSPQMPDNASFPNAEDDNQNNLEVQSSDQPVMSGLGLTRTSSTERGTSARNSTHRGTVGPSSSSHMAIGPTVAQPFNVAGSLPMRLRALSQPSKRPGMPSFHSDFGQAVPPIPASHAPAPNMQRADSDPLAGPNGNEQPPPTPVMPTTPMSFDYPASMEDSIYNVPGISVGNDDSADQAISPTSTQTGGLSRTAPSHATSFLEPDTPASAMFQQQQQHASPVKGPTIEYQAPPSDIMRVPFHFMRQIRTSILSGAYLTPRLYIPKQLWGQPSMKLVHTETKVRMLDLLLNGLEAIERAGDVLLLDGQIKAGNTGSKIDAANRLMRELESFEGMLDGVQSTLAKKLTYVEQPNGKKGGGGSFGAWSSKISRSMDRMTKGKNLDAPETYVAAIARLCLHAQILDRHLASLHGTMELHGKGSNGTGASRSSQDFTFGSNGHSAIALSSMIPPATPGIAPSGYNDIPPDRRVYIEKHLKRSSDFFSKVICKMFLNDLGIWLDKYSKRAAGWTTD